MHCSATNGKNHNGLLDQIYISLKSVFYSLFFQYLECDPDQFTVCFSFLIQIYSPCLGNPPFKQEDFFCGLMPLNIQKLVILWMLLPTFCYLKISGYVHSFPPSSFKTARNILDI